MTWILALVFACLPPQTHNDAAGMFETAPSWTQFLANVAAQRERWTRNATRATVPPPLAARMARAAPGLRLLVVAQDWCLDSANTVPYIAQLAASAQVPMHVLDRKAGEALLNRNRSRDGREVTPLVLLLRGGRVIAAWIERPVPLQQAFERMLTDADARRMFEDRQAWYDRDSGRTTMGEIVALAEQTPR